MADDLENQRKETYSIFEDLESSQELPAFAVVDFQFVPFDGSADWLGFQNEVKVLGYQTRVYEDGSTLEVSTQPITLSAELIWSHEKQLTLIGHKHRFSADGWGFWGVNSDETPFA